MRTGYVVIGDFVTGRDDDEITTEMVILWTGKSRKAAKRIAAEIAANPPHQLSTALLPAMRCFYPAVGFSPFEYQAEQAAKTAPQLTQTVVVQVRDHVPRVAIKRFEVKGREYLQAMPRQYASPVPQCSVSATAVMTYVGISSELQCFDLPTISASED